MSIKFLLYFVAQSTFNMKNDSESLQDIKAIRKLMEESTRFLSLSGLSGVFAGLTAIAGALFVYFGILESGTINLNEFLKALPAQETTVLRFQLVAAAVIVLAVSVLFAFWFSMRKAKKDGKKFWSPVSGRLLINLLIPLITGGILTIVFMLQNQVQLIIPGFLIFYGLALVNAGKFTFGEIFYLGILEIITGLVAAFIPGWNLIFWILGFGLLHIIYGLAMSRKYGA